MSGPNALIVGSDDVDDQGLRAIWIDLAEPLVTPAPDQAREDQRRSARSTATPTSSSGRVRLAEAASAAAPTDPPLLRPIVNYECGYCPWWSTCRPQLDDDDLSLRISKSPLDVHEISVLRGAGVATVSQLAASDLDLLLPDYLPQVAHRTRCRGTAAARAASLAAAAWTGSSWSEPPKARSRFPVPSLEIDIDVETSREDRVYLWGFWVADGNGSGSYHEFSGFTDLDDSDERELARAAMTWLRDLIGDSDARVYHYSDYEMVRLGRLARGEPGLDWAMDFAREALRRPVPDDPAELLRHQRARPEGRGLRRRRFPLARRRPGRPEQHALVRGGRPRPHRAVARAGSRPACWSTTRTT